MYEYGMATELKQLLDEIKYNTRAILTNKGYTVDKANEAIESIKNFKVTEIATGFRIETLVDDFKIIVFYHTDKTEVTFYSEEKEPKPTTKTVIIQDENDALNQGRIVSAFEHQTNDRLEKFENWLSSLQSLVDTVADNLNDDVKERVQNLEKHLKCVESDVKLINGKLKFIGDNLSCR